MCSFFQIRDFNLGPTILLPSEIGTAEQVDKKRILERYHYSYEGLA
jgi:hypothetical protein